MSNYVNVKEGSRSVFIPALIEPRRIVIAGDEMSRPKGPIACIADSGVRFWRVL